MTTDQFAHPVNVLLVEDNPGDVRLTQEGLKESKILNNLSVVGDGVEALAFLRQQGQYADAFRPDMILLDLNLPRKDGREVLEEIKSDPDLKRIPVVVLKPRGPKRTYSGAITSTPIAISRNPWTWSNSSRWSRR